MHESALFVLARPFVTRLKSRYRVRADELAWRRAANRGRSNRVWEWIVGAVFLTVIILTGYRSVMTQHHLEKTQSELENAKQAADQEKAQAAQLAKWVASLNSELEKTKARRNGLQTNLDQATSEIQSAQLKNKQSLQSELENAKQGQRRQEHRLRSWQNVSIVSVQSLRKQMLDAMSFRPNWIEPPWRFIQPNPSLRTSSLCRASLRTLSRRQSRQERRLRSSRNGSPVSVQSLRKQILDAMSFRPNWIGPPRRSISPIPA